MDPIVLELGECTTEQKRLFPLVYRTLAGNPAMPEGPTQFSLVSGGSIALTEADGSPLPEHSVYLISADVPGDVIVDAVADADLGPGVRPIQARLVLHVGPAEVGVVGLAGAPPAVLK